ncbi:hypothetical protein J4E83_004698 [Alternaria metachromatica]|uniref:uncharacterized protein n=1 Tax=Alternaria metachromatica TaxID=283354 RepID=UPI0020C3E0F1|nr:uncharacterized protein J4E83_004698 [Alternaria metachromatica]KAI4623305.1 hypothetical protein J4E83_004698 [Alternaria metachromatica]
MALSNPASGTALSVTSTPDADLASALDMLAMQNRSIPTPSKCHIDRCATEIMIQVAESLDYKGLCSLARASKRYTEVAQDVLYRFVDLRPEDQDSEYLEGSDDESTFDRPTKSALAVFLWTIKQKPHLATKVQDLWFLPRSLPVEYPQLMYSGVSPVSLMVKPGSYVIEVDEKNLACDLLARLTELRSLTITALDEYTCNTELDYPDGYGQFYRKGEINKNVFGRFPIPVENLVRLPCFSKLTSIYLSHGYLDWSVVTLPTLHALCIGIRARLETPSQYAEAPNITSLTVGAGNEAQDVDFRGAHKFQRPAGSSPSQLLPRGIRTLVITHPRSPGPDDGDCKSKLTSWLGELTKTDFPDLERVEVVCSVGYGDGVGFKQRLEQSAEVRFLETIGVAVVVRKE